MLTAMCPDALRKVGPNAKLLQILIDHGWDPTTASFNGPVDQTSMLAVMGPYVRFPATDRPKPKPIHKKPKPPTGPRASLDPNVVTSSTNLDSTDTFYSRSQSMNFPN